MQQEENCFCYWKYFWKGEVHGTYIVHNTAIRSQKVWWTPNIPKALFHTKLKEIWRMSLVEIWEIFHLPDQHISKDYIFKSGIFLCKNLHCNILSNLWNPALLRVWYFLLENGANLRYRALIFVSLDFWHL